MAVIGTRLINGCAFRFATPAGGWSGNIVGDNLVPGDRTAGDQFSAAIGIAGDVTIIGSHRDADAGNASGSAYVYGVPCGDRAA